MYYEDNILGSTPNGAQGLLLELCSEITAGGFEQTYRVPGIHSRDLIQFIWKQS